MAHFRGTIQGQRGAASRLGSKASGLTVEAQSWEGKVVVRLRATPAGDYVTIRLEPHRNAGTSRELYDGPVNGNPHGALARQMAQPVETTMDLSDLRQLGRGVAS